MLTAHGVLSLSRYVCNAGTEIYLDGTNLENSNTLNAKLSQQQYYKAVMEADNFNFKSP